MSAAGDPAEVKEEQSGEAGKESARRAGQRGGWGRGDSEKLLPEANKSSPSSVLSLTSPVVQGWALAQKDVGKGGDLFSDC